MGIYSRELPQLQDKIFITDAGMETEFWFKRKIELPEFAAYDLLRTRQGFEIIFDYFCTYAKLGRKYNKGLVLETPTWRASSDWGKKIGDNADDLAQLNKKGVELLQQIRSDYQSEEVPIVISGCLGPRGDGYVPEKRMTVSVALQYHSQQIQTLVEAGVDMVSAFTMNYPEEAIGIVKAAQAFDIPVVISFTVETDGCLPSGESLSSVIKQVDLATRNGPAYYMINCAHPTHFTHLFGGDADAIERIKGIRGNSSCKSHEELDNSAELDEGNPDEFGIQCHTLHGKSRALNILGGCCGTDHRHIEAICRQF